MRDTAGRLLLDRSVPGLLNVAIPAALQGVNEFDEPIIFYDEVLEPFDPRLVPIGPPPPLPIMKQAGAPTGGTVIVSHRGEGGRFKAGYEIAPARLLGHGDTLFDFVQTVDVPPHVVSTPVFIFIAERPWPSEAAAPPGSYDALKFIDNVDTGETIYRDWDDDVFEVPG